MLGRDKTLKRRRRAKVATKGFCCNAVRSSRDFFVKSSGLRLVSLMLANISWANRV